MTSIHAVNEEEWLTSIDLLLNSSLLRAFVHLGDILLSTWAVDVAWSVHNLLKRVTFPTKNIVAVITEASPGNNIWIRRLANLDGYLLITEAPDKWLRTAIRPDWLVIKWSRIPDCLEHKLGCSNWVWSRTGAVNFTWATASIPWISYVAFVVRRIKVLPVPAAALMWAEEQYEILNQTHVGKKRLTIIPDLHGVFGKSLIIGERVIKFSRQI